jgi:hypothetical protein
MIGINGFTVSTNMFLLGLVGLSFIVVGYIISDIQVHLRDRRLDRAEAEAAKHAEWFQNLPPERDDLTDPNLKKITVEEEVEGELVFSDAEWEELEAELNVLTPRSVIPVHVSHLDNGYRGRHHTDEAALKAPTGQFAIYERQLELVAA